MNKKIVNLGLSIVLASSLLTACGDNSGSSIGANNDKNSTTGEKVLDFEDNKVFVLNINENKDGEVFSKTVMVDNQLNEIFSQENVQLSFVSTGIIRKDCPLVVAEIIKSEEPETDEYGYENGDTYLYGVYDIEKGKWTVEPEYIYIGGVTDNYEYFLDDSFNREDLMFSLYDETYSDGKLVDVDGNIILDHVDYNNGGIELKNGEICLCDYTEGTEVVYSRTGEELETREIDTSSWADNYVVDGYTVEYGDDGETECVIDEDGTVVVNKEILLNTLGVEDVEDSFMSVDDINRETGLYNGSINGCFYVCSLDGRCLFYQAYEAMGVKSVFLTETGYQIYDMENENSEYYDKDGNIVENFEEVQTLESYFSDNTTAEFSEDGKSIIVTTADEKQYTLDISDIDALSVTTLSKGSEFYMVEDGINSIKLFKEDKALGVYAGYAYMSDEYIIIADYKHNESNGEVISGKAMVMNADGDIVYESTGSEIVESVVGSYMVITRGNYIGITNMEGEYLYKTVTTVAAGM